MAAAGTAALTWAAPPEASPAEPDVETFDWVVESEWAGDEAVGAAGSETAAPGTGTSVLVGCGWLRRFGVPTAFVAGSVLSRCVTDGRRDVGGSTMVGVPVEPLASDGGAASVAGVADGGPR